MEAFKEAFSEVNVLRIARAAADVWPEFPLDDFRAGLAQALAGLELKQRVAHVADRLAAGLPADPAALFPILVAMLDGQPTGGWHIRPSAGLSGFAVWPLTELVARCGLDHPELAYQALREMTIRFTAEFAIRPFLRHRRELTLAQLHRWVEDENPHVRRLASEGSRPFLPWGMQLPELLEPPHPTLGLLERLHCDESAMVRLSVANHLNDITKRQPALVLGLLRRWLADAPGDQHQLRLARHACRTLVKAGHPEALELLGAAPAGAVETRAFELVSDVVEWGGELQFQVIPATRSSQTARVLLDYRLELLRKHGSWSPKVFKWKVLDVPPHAEVCVTGRHSFRDVTTRRHYAGVQFIRPQVNGVAGTRCEFELRAP